MSEIILRKEVVSLPQQLDPNCLYFVRVGNGFDIYLSDQTGQVAHKLNSSETDSSSFSRSTEPLGNISILYGVDLNTNQFKIAIQQEITHNDFKVHNGSNYTIIPGYVYINSTAGSVKQELDYGQNIITIPTSPVRSNEIPNRLLDELNLSESDVYSSSEFEIYLMGISAIRDSNILGMKEVLSIRTVIGLYDQVVNYGYFDSSNRFTGFNTLNHIIHTERGTKSKPTGLLTIIRGTATIFRTNNQLIADISNINTEAINEFGGDDTLTGKFKVFKNRLSKIFKSKFQDNNVQEEFSNLTILPRDSYGKAVVFNNKEGNIFSRDYYQDDRIYYFLDSRNMIQPLQGDISLDRGNKFEDLKIISSLSDGITSTTRLSIPKTDLVDLVINDNNYPGSALKRLISQMIDYPESIRTFNDDRIDYNGFEENLSQFPIVADNYKGQFLSEVKIYFSVFENKVRTLFFNNLSTLRRDIASSNSIAYIHYYYNMYSAKDQHLELKTSTLTDQYYDQNRIRYFTDPFLIDIYRKCGSSFNNNLNVSSENPVTIYLFSSEDYVEINELISYLQPNGTFSNVPQDKVAKFNQLLNKITVYKQDIIGFSFEQNQFELRDFELLSLGDLLGIMYKTVEWGGSNNSKSPKISPPSPPPPPHSDEDYGIT